MLAANMNRGNDKFLKIVAVALIVIAIVIPAAASCGSDDDYDGPGAFGDAFGIVLQ